MGGIGSGPGKSLAVVEEGLKLDLRRLRQQGLFKPDGHYRQVTLRWTNSATGEEVASCSMSYCAGDHEQWLALKYRHTPYGADEATHVNDRFWLTRLPQPFGGYRWYFLCPKTGVRCQCLYKPCGYSYFRARRLFRGKMLYRSQKEDWRSRAFERSRRAARKILKAGSPEWQEQYEDWEFPPKPPRMRWKTYDRQLAEWEEAERLSDTILAQWVMKLG